MSILREYRCKNCGKLFFKGEVQEGKIQIKCKSCKSLNIIKKENCFFLSKVILDVLNRKEISRQNIEDVIEGCRICERRRSCPYFNSIKDLAEYYSLSLVNVGKVLQEESFPIK